jgi:hypothetical protein
LYEAVDRGIKGSREKVSIKIAAGERSGERARTWGWWLPLAGTGMVLLYLLFTLGYRLTEYYDVFIPVSQETKPLFSLAERGLVLFDKWVYIVAIAALHAVYLGAFALLLRRAWTSRGGASQAHSRTIIVVSVACSLILLWSYPLFSQDVFDYLFQTREWVAYGANPYTNIPDNFRADALFRYVSWTQAPSAYGPLWLFLTAPLSLLANDSLLINVILFKALSILGYLGTIWMVHLTLGKIAPRFRLAGTVLFAWNPIMLIEFAGSGHNDVLMLFFTALAIWLVANGRYTLSLLALTAGGLIKVVPLLLIPLFLLYVWRQLSRDATNTRPQTPTNLVTALRRKPLLYLAASLFACALFAVAAYLPFWDGPAALSFLYRGDMMAGAVLFNHVLGLLLLLGLEFTVAMFVVKLAAYGGFGIYFVRQAWQAIAAGTSTIFILRPLRLTGIWLRARIGDERLARAGILWWAREEPQSVDIEDDLSRLMRLCLGVLVFFTMYASLYYQPWYLTWSLLFLPYLLAPRYKWHVLTLTLVSVITTMGFVFV